MSNQAKVSGAFIDAWYGGAASGWGRGDGSTVDAGAMDALRRRFPKELEYRRGVLSRRRRWPVLAGPRRGGPLPAPCGVSPGWHCGCTWLPRAGLGPLSGGPMKALKAVGLAACRVVDNILSSTVTKRA